MTSVLRHTLGRHSRSIALWALLVATASAALVALTAIDGAAPRAQLAIPWWALLIAFAATERCPVQVHFRRSAHVLTLGEIPLIVGLVFDAPMTVVCSYTAAMLIVLLPSRTVPVRLVYNITNVWAVTALVSFTIHAIDHAGHAGLWLGAALGVLAASTLSALILSAAMALSGERMEWGRVRAMVLMGLVVSGTNASLALAATSVLEADPSGGLLLVAPIAVLYGAYRAYTTQRHQNLNLKFLYDASRTLARSDDSAVGLAGMLAMALETFRAEVAEVCMLPAAEGEAGTRVTVGPDQRVDVLEPVSPEVAAELRALADGDLTAKVVRTDELEGPLAERLADMGVREAMIAGLPGDSRLVGTMMIANRFGVVPFGPADQRLFETLAGHTGATLGQDHLERRVVELHETKEQLYHQAFHDALTGLANRLLFDDRVAYALARRTGNAVVIYIDLDDFKPVNDTYGHDAGDALLCAVGDRLRNSLRPSDTAARLGGDEFAVLLLDVAARDVPTIADRILRNFAAPVDVGGGATAGISASMGIAMADSGSMSAEELLRKADAAMYVAKRGGKRGYTFHEPGAAVTA